MFPALLRVRSPCSDTAVKVDPEAPLLYSCGNHKLLALLSTWKDADKYAHTHMLNFRKPLETFFYNTTSGYEIIVKVFSACAEIVQCLNCACTHVATNALWYELSVYSVFTCLKHP